MAAHKKNLMENSVPKQSESAVPSFSVGIFLSIKIKREFIKFYNSNSRDRKPLEQSLICPSYLSVSYRKVKVLVAQSCVTCCNTMDHSPPSSSVHGILQARILEWVAIPFSRGSSQPRDQTQVSCIAGRFFTV